MSRRATLIKQRQLEAKLRQKQEIEERDLARQQKEYGHSKSQVAPEDNGPKSMQDLFKSRFKPSQNAVSNSSKPDNDAEAARLKLYEQKRARFLAKKRAQAQRQQNIPPQHPSSVNYQNHSPQPQQQQLFQQPSSQKSFHIEVSPPKQQRPQVTFSDDKYENPSYTESNDSNDSAINRTSNKDVSRNNAQYQQQHQQQIDEWQQKKAKQEQYKMDLMQQMNQRQPQSQNHAVDNYPNTNSQPMQGNNEYDAMQEKKAKQEAYRQSLLQQQQMKRQQNNQQYKQDNAQNSFIKFDDAKEKKLKQEQYRMELMQQMQMKKQNEIKIKPHHTNNNHNALPFSQNAQEQKRAKQEKYRLELEEQMRQRKAQQARRSDFNSHAAEMKEKEDLDEDRRQKYAMELEQQMENKRLSKMAEKEKELLEDRRNTMNGSFLDGFGNNPIPKISQPQNAYKMELDMQRKSFLEQERMKDSMNHNSQKQQEQYQAMPYQDSSKDAKLEKMNQYKRDLDEQRRQLQQRKEAQKQKEENEALRLEQKIKNDRDELIKQKANEDRDGGGIFGSSAEQEKMKKAKKMEAYQQELKRQSEEAKRKKEEKLRKEKEEEKRLEMKIKREMKELEDRYKAEKERESISTSPTKQSNNLVNVSKQMTVVHTPPKAVKKTPKIMKNENTIPRISDIPMEESNKMMMLNKPLSARRSQRPSSASSSKLFQELLSLKQDLLQNQEMIRKELQIHKEQIHQQMVSKTNENVSKPKSFEDEMSKYHNRITNEIEDLKKAIIKQRSMDKQQRTYPHSARSHSSRPRSRKQKKERMELMESSLTTFDRQLSVKNHSKFVMPTAPSTPALIRPETGMTVFSMNDESTTQNLSRLNTGLTELGVDEYLLNESKKNNEYLQFTSKCNSRAHTPNIYRIDSIERDLLAQQYNNAQSVSNNNKNNHHMMEKSIRSKSDFLYNVMASKQEDERNERREKMKKQASNNQSIQSNDSMLSKLLTKNKNRLQYFRQTTPLDATRSMKIGLQKIEDLLDETERLNASQSRRKKYKQPQREQNDFDDSLYELM